MSHKVHISDTGESFTVSAEETILDAALKAGIKLPHECTFGGCATCRVKLDQGSVHYDEFPMALTEEEHEQGYALACQAHPDSDIVLTPAGKGLELPEPVIMNATITSITPLTPTITHLELQLPDDADVDYRPGQHMNIRLPGQGDRSFSMASAYPFGNTVDFHIRRVSGGHFTDMLLGKLKTGDTLEVEIPRGTFCLHADDWRPIIFAATGTGFAPIRAILESLLDNEDCPPLWFYWGVRTPADLYAAQELASWASRLYEFNFIPVLSRADDSWEGRRGYVQDAIAQDFDDVSDHAFYLCGSPEMVADTKRTLISLKADLDFIYSDSFTFHHNESPAAA